MRYSFGDYLLDTQRYEFSRAGEPIPLRPKVFQVLAHLLAYRDRVVLKQELLEHVWPEQYVGDAALNSYIMAVRKAIGDDGHTHRLLRTVRGRGYRFVADVAICPETRLHDAAGAFPRVSLQSRHGIRGPILPHPWCRTETPCPWSAVASRIICRCN